MSPPNEGPLHVLDRYALFDEIAAGGMATVHLGRLLGPVGFSRTVAIKRLHPQYAKDAEFVQMFLDEARLASRIRHPNVVQTIDVVAKEGELFLVMEYVLGESLARLMTAVRKAGERVPLDVLSGIAVGFLNGLHAAHEAKDEHGAPLNLVHRDVSPQNVLVGVDGVARALDFGIAKAASQVHSTREGQLKGKLAYMAPEQLEGQTSRATDVYASAVVVWEALAAQRLFSGDSEKVVLGKVLAGAKIPPSHHNPEVPPELDAVVMRGLAAEVDDRFKTALEMARALSKAMPSAPSADVGEWVEKTARASIDERARTLARIESTSMAGSDVANRLAAAAASGTDPRLALESIPPPSEVPRGAPSAPALVAIGVDAPPASRPALHDEAIDELLAAGAPAPPVGPSLLHTGDTIPTQLGASLPRRTSAVERADGRWRALVLGASLVAAIALGGFIRWSLVGAGAPRTAAASQPAPAASTVAATARPPVPSASPPAAEPPSTGIAHDDVAAPSSVPGAAALPAAPPAPPAPSATSRKPRWNAPPRGVAPRIDDPLLQAR